MSNDAEIHKVLDYFLIRFDQNKFVLMSSVVTSSMIT